MKFLKQNWDAILFGVILFFVSYFLLETFLFKDLYEERRYRSEYAYYLVK